MKQFVLLFEDVAIEYTGYFKSEKECIQYTKKRYKNGGEGILIRAVYPVLEDVYYCVKTGKKVNTNV
jgi:hypothetical protein